MNLVEWMKHVRRQAGIGALALLMTSALLPAAASAGARSSRADELPNERTVSSWAHAQRLASVRRLPSGRSRVVARLHHRTEDGFGEVYPVLRHSTDPAGRGWLAIRVPMRPRARTGWVRDTAMGPLYSVRTRFVIDRVTLRAALYRSGRRIWRSAIGVGKPGTATPAGDFWIREKFRVPNPGGTYGPRAFGTSGYSRLSDWPGGGVIGIHGTDQPELIPGRPSYGCIRIPNHAIKRLYRLMPIGTPVDVR